MRKNHTRKAPANYTTEYIRLPHRPDLARITLEPMKTICINMCAFPGCDREYIAKRHDDHLLQIIQRQI